MASKTKTKGGGTRTTRSRSGSNASKPADAPEVAARATRRKRGADTTSEERHEEAVHARGGEHIGSEDTAKSTSLTPSLEESNISGDGKPSKLQGEEEEGVGRKTGAAAMEGEKNNDGGGAAAASTAAGGSGGTNMDVDGSNDKNSMMEVDDEPEARIVVPAITEEPSGELNNEGGPNMSSAAAAGAKDNADVHKKASSNSHMPPPSAVGMDITATTSKLTGVSTAADPTDNNTTEPFNAASGAAATPAAITAPTAASQSPSFSMTLAIGPEDTRRVFAASKAFNVEIKRLQKMDEDAAAAMERTKMKGDNKKTRRGPVVVHSPPSRAELQQLREKQRREQPPGVKPPPPVHEPAQKEKRQEEQQPSQQQPRGSQKSLRPLRELLLPAARTTNDALISSFLEQMDKSKCCSEEEKRISLLFFLDADKSTKLLASFDVLGNNADGGEKDVEDGKDDGGVAAEGRKEGGDTGGRGEEDDGSSNLIGRSGSIKLFQSCLTSISTCVHGPGSEGGTTAAKGDWKGSDQTAKEIMEVATFAADNLIEYAKRNPGGEEKKEADGGAGDEKNQVSVNEGKDDKEAGVVSFDIFGEWYNSGGFSLVPWLELLDLSKWDYKTTNTAAEDDGAAAAGQLSSSMPSPSSSKRPRINEPLTPYGASTANMNEPIGSPTQLFASGAFLGGDTPQQKQHPTKPPPPGQESIRSFSAMFGEMDDSRTVVSFDFSGSSPPGDHHNAREQSLPSFHIDITEENLVMLRNLVKRTGFANMSPQQVEALMLKHSRVERGRENADEPAYVISRAQFGKFIREVIPKDTSRQFDPTEIENYSNYFTNFFTCFDYSWCTELKRDEVNAKEFLVGFSFLFAGNKSTKLAAAYEMLDVEKKGYLTQRGLMRYLRSYLTMLAGISLLSANKKTTTHIRKRLMIPSLRDDAFLAVENGAKWTLSHFLRAFEAHLAATNQNSRNSTRSNAVTFEDFARWYTEGGYAVAPWLELLDLQKFLSLIGGDSSKNPLGAPSTEANVGGGEVLFTFPLTDNRSLVVLRDDALYVKSVVTDLGLLSLTSEDIWNVLYNDVAKSMQTAAAAGGEGGKKSGGNNVKKSVSMEVDQSTFTQCMMRILSGTGQIKQYSTWGGNDELNPEETLKNFYLSFDIAEKNCVPLNQLMCGLTLLCGGKKSNKLVFAFSLFGTEPKNNSKKKQTSAAMAAYMTHDDFLFFFQSFLIVMFSCCNQSLTLNAETVTQYISDTARSVADDVMAYWKAKKVEKVKFEHFSEWYNEGGFETAPWLELLDLNKWVLAPTEQQQPVAAQQQQQHPMTPAQKSSAATSAHTPGLTPGHEAIKALLATPRMTPGGGGDLGAIDSLFDLDMSAVDGEVDEMDFILQNETAAAHHQSHVENVNYVDPTAAAAAAATAQTPSKPAAVAQPQHQPVQQSQSALKFNLITKDQFGGYIISIGPPQVELLRRIVTETGLCQVDAADICKFIIYDVKSRRPTNLDRPKYTSSMKRIFEHASKSLQKPVSKSTQEEVSAFTDKLFTTFDRTNIRKVNALELACGFTVLCAGRKSDKLEHVFELLDEDKGSNLNRKDITRFISSFLIMLMSVSTSFTHLYGGLCSNDGEAMARAVEAGSEWATSQVFDALRPTSGNITFDDFADWYTKGGYQSVPWLELLDLRKWVLGGAP